MKKLMLDLDALVVESFETHRVQGLGTVAANQIPDRQAYIRTYPNCSEIDGCPSALAPCSYDLSCNGTCDSCNSCNSCVDSCLSNCFNTGCNGCSGPVCVAQP